MLVVLVIVVIPMDTILAADAVYIGRVIRLIGNVHKINTISGEESTLKLGDKIYEKDQMVTNNSSYIKILMKDDTIFQLGANSHFKFDKFKFKTKKNRKAKYKLLYGQLRSLFTVKAKNRDNLKLETPTVSMGIRGTEFATQVYRGKRGQAKTDVVLFTGKLAINSKELKKVVMMKPGQMFNAANIATKAPVITKAPVKMFKYLTTTVKKGGVVFINDAANEKDQKDPNSFLPLPPAPNKPVDDTTSDSRPEINSTPLSTKCGSNEIKVGNSCMKKPSANPQAKIKCKRNEVFTGTACVRKHKPEVLVPITPKKCKNNETLIGGSCIKKNKAPTPITPKKCKNNETLVGDSCIKNERDGRTRQQSPTPPTLDTTPTPAPPPPKVCVKWHTKGAKKGECKQYK